MYGCQNYGPLLGPLNTRCRIILRTPKRTIVLTIPHILRAASFCRRGFPETLFIEHHSLQVVASCALTWDGVRWVAARMLLWPLAADDFPRAVVGSPQSSKNRSGSLHTSGVLESLYDGSHYSGFILGAPDFWKLPSINTVQTCDGEVRIWEALERQGMYCATTRTLVKRGSVRGELRWAIPIPREAPSQRFQIPHDFRH